MFCGICTFAYNKSNKQPLLMDCCGRSICFTCCNTIEDESENKEIHRKCPYCQSVVKKNLITQAKNYSLMECLPTRYTSKCKTHDSLSVLICEDCNEDLCAKCLLSHFKLDHNIIEFEQFTEKISMLENELKPYIKEGSKKLQLYSLLIEMRQKNMIELIEDKYNQYLYALSEWKNQSIEDLTAFHECMMKKWVINGHDFDENNMISKINLYIDILDIEENMTRDFEIKKFYENLNHKELKTWIKYDDYNLFLEELNKTKLTIKQLENPFIVSHNEMREENFPNFSETLGDFYQELIYLRRDNDQTIFINHPILVLDQDKKIPNTLNLAILDHTNHEMLKEITEFHVLNSLNSILPICKTVSFLRIKIDAPLDTSFLGNLDHFTTLLSLELDIILIPYRNLLDQIAARIKKMRFIKSLKVKIPDKGNQEDLREFFKNLSDFSNVLRAIRLSGFEISDSLYEKLTKVVDNASPKLNHLELHNFFWESKAQMSNFLGEKLLKFNDLIIFNFSFRNFIDQHLVNNLNYLAETLSILSSFTLMYSLDDSLEALNVDFRYLIETLSKKKSLKIFKMRKIQDTNLMPFEIHCSYFKRRILRNFLENKMIIFEVDCLQQKKKEPVFPKKIDPSWLTEFTEFEYSGRFNLKYKRFHFLINSFKEASKLKFFKITLLIAYEQSFEYIREISKTQLKCKQFYRLIFESNEKLDHDKLISTDKLLGCKLSHKFEINFKAEQNELKIILNPQIL